MDEEAITRYVCTLLRQLGWSIHSVHYPGAQGGLYIAADNGRRVLPDILASHSDLAVLVVETKPSFTRADATKAADIAAAARYRNGRARLCEALGLPESWFAAVAFAHPRPQEASLPDTLAVVAFHVGPGLVTVSNVPAALRGLLPEGAHQVSWEE